MISTALNGCYTCRAETKGQGQFGPKESAGHFFTWAINMSLPPPVKTLRFLSTSSLLQQRPSATTRSFVTSEEQLHCLDLSVAELTPEPEHLRPPPP